MTVNDFGISGSAVLRRLQWLRVFIYMWMDDDGCMCVATRIHGIEDAFRQPSDPRVWGWERPLKVGSQLRRSNQIHLGSRQRCCAVPRKHGRKAIGIFGHDSTGRLWKVLNIWCDVKEGNSSYEPWGTEKEALIDLLLCPKKAGRRKINSGILVHEMLWIWQ